MAQADCPLCGGTGWRVVERVNVSQSSQAVPSKHAPRGAPPVPRATCAVPCDCTGQDRAQRALSRARVPKRYEHCDFDNFDTDIWEGQSNSPQAPAWDRSLAQAKLVVEAFARKYPLANETGLLLMGSCGVGKTHLAVAALKQLIQRGHDALFYDYRELLKQIQSSYSPENPLTELGVLEPVFETEILLIDDLGAGKPSPWVLETIGHILNKRYNDKRVTLLTTNYLDSETQPSSPRFPSGEKVGRTAEESLSERLGQRVRSRLYEMCRTIEIAAPDYRREIRHAGRVRSS